MCDKCVIAMSLKKSSVLQKLHFVLWIANDENIECVVCIFSVQQANNIHSEQLTLLLIFFLNTSFLLYIYGNKNTLFS